MVVRQNMDSQLGGVLLGIDHGGSFNSFEIRFLAFVSFLFFVIDTIMCQYLKQEFKWKRTFQIG